MERQNQQGLKWVLSQIRPGHLIDTPTLRQHGVDRKDVYRYIRGGWLERAAQGVYRRPGATSTSDEWHSVVHSLQALMDYDSVVGGRTALEARGFGHYLRLGTQTTVHLYGDNHPSWLPRLKGPAKYVLHSTKLFSKGTGEHSEFDTSSGAIRCSSPERAILELLDELPGAESFHVVDSIFEGLSSARPGRLERLLDACRSIKVKRLFFVFADRHRHGWRPHLDPRAFDLGAGDRALVKGGSLHPEYRIVVPGEFIEASEGQSGA